MASEHASAEVESESISAVHLVVIVAVLHLTLGLYNWLRWASAGFLVPRDVRWPLFVVSGLALFAGLLLAAQGRNRRQLYAGGIALMVVYVVGYFSWHLGGHGFVFREPLPHDGPVGQFLLDHLFAGPVKTLALVSEVVLAAVLAYLLARE